MQDSLGDRMKGYEAATKVVLPRRMPIIIRVDGKAFHTYTQNCEKPFDRKLIAVMEKTAIELCTEIQGAQIAYTQSDEISILVHNYKHLNSGAWFDNQLQKMVSVAAAVASATFTANSWKIWADPVPHTNHTLAQMRANHGGWVTEIKPAYFDARAFVLPEAEVCNYFIWRQKDATRNSVQMLARSLYSHKQCDNKNVVELQEMCRKKCHDWLSLSTTQKRGRCIKRMITGQLDALRSHWEVDTEIPVFTENREYINKHLVVEEET